MSAPLTAEYLAEVQARVVATTREDWSIDHGDGGTVSVGPFSFIEGWDGGAPHPADIEFTSKARRDVPQLLGEVGRLRAKLAAVGLLTMQNSKAPGPWQAGYQAALGDLRAVLDIGPSRCGRALSTGQPCLEHDAPPVEAGAQ